MPVVELPPLDSVPVDAVPLPVRGFVPSVLDAVHAPDGVAAWAASACPSGEVIAALAAVDAGLLSAAGRVDALRAWDRVASFVAARQLELLSLMAAESGAGGPAGMDRSWANLDVAGALRLSSGAATYRLLAARELDRLPVTRAALAGGEITAAQARVLAEELVRCTDAQARSIEAELIPQAGELSITSMRRRLRRLLIKVAPRSANERHAEAMARRRVVFVAQEHGMTDAYASLPADGALTVQRALAEIARRDKQRDPHDGRTAEQRRADALVHLAACALDGVLPVPTAGPLGVRPHIQVTIAASTLLALDGQPGELAGYGPIPSAMARRIAADPTGRLRKLLTDDAGHPRGYGRRTYRPPANLAGFVTARDQTCRVPNCNRPAITCDIDHCLAWIDGGETEQTNLHALCAEHHKAKHEAGWHIERHPDGTTTWTSPTGHRYTKKPERLPTTTTSAPARPRESRLVSNGDPDPPPF